jgi:hypothetical protein
MHFLQKVCESHRVSGKKRDYLRHFLQKLCQNCPIPDTIPRHLATTPVTMTDTVKTTRVSAKKGSHGRL